MMDEETKLKLQELTIAALREVKAEEEKSKPKESLTTEKQDQK